MSPLLVNLGYVLMLAAFLVRDILWLRGILIFAQSSLALYGLVIDRMPMVYWNGLFVIINTIWVIKILRERRPVQIPAEWADLYAQIFKTMTPREFLDFWGSGAVREKTSELIVRENERQQELFLILDGKAEVLKNERVLASLTRGHFIAEMSFLTGQPASADVRADGPLRYISWDQEKLRNWKSANPQLFMKIQGILGSDLVEKIRQANLTLHWQWSDS